MGGGEGHREPIQHENESMNHIQFFIVIRPELYALEGFCRFHKNQLLVDLISNLSQFSNCISDDISISSSTSLLTLTGLIRTIIASNKLNFNL